MADDYDPIAQSLEQPPEGKTPQQLEAESEIADLVWLMSSKRGRRIVWRLLARARVFQLSHTGEALSTAFNEGQRNFGLRLTVQIISECPDLYSRMLTEHSENVRRNADDADRSGS
jgi:hypothetical protein